MKSILSFNFVVLFALLVITGDNAIRAAIAHDIIRAIFYGVASILILITIILDFVT